MEPGPRRALEAVGAHLGHPRVVVRPGAPGRLDAGAHRGNARARLARVDRAADAERVQGDAALARHLGQVQRVGGRAADGRRAEALDGGEPLGRVLSAARNGQRAEGARALEAGPEADEEPEGEREEHPVAGPDPGGAQDEAPAARPPVPRLLGVEPAERRSRGARGLMHAHVAREGKGEGAAERRMGRLVVDQLRLRRVREPEEVLPAREIAGRAHARAPPLAGDEGIGGKDGPREGLEPGPLVRAERVGAERLQRAIVESRHARSL